MKVGLIALPHDALMLFSFAAIPVVEPTKVVVRPSTSVSYASSSSSTPGPVVTPKPNVKENSLLVTLPGYSVETV